MCPLLPTLAKEFPRGSCITKERADHHHHPEEEEVLDTIPNPLLLGNSLSLQQSFRSQHTKKVAKGPDSAPRCWIYTVCTTYMKPPVSVPQNSSIWKAMSSRQMCHQDQE